MDAYFQKKMKCSFVQRIKKAINYFSMRKNIWGSLHFALNCTGDMVIVSKLKISHCAQNTYVKNYKAACEN